MEFIIVDVDVKPLLLVLMSTLSGVTDDLAEGMTLAFGMAKSPCHWISALGNPHVIVLLYFYLIG